MTENYYNIRDLKGSFAEHPPVGLLNRPAPTPASERYRTIVLRPDLVAPPVIIKTKSGELLMPRDGWPEFVRPEQEERILPGTLVLPPGGWAMALVELDALEAIPADISHESEEVAANYAAPSWLNKTVLKIVVKDVPQGMRVNWSKVAAAGLLLPVAVVASEHVRANVNPQDLLLKASAAPQAIIQQMPSIPSLQPGVIHRLFNKTTKSAGEKFTNMQQPVPPEIQEEIAPVQTEPAPPVKTEKAPVIAETHDTDIQLPSAPAIPAKKSPVIETFSASSCGDYKAPQNIERLLRDVTKGDRNVSYEVMHCLLGSESGFKNVKSHSGAVGIGQWTEGPFLERLLKIKKFLSDDERKIANNVQSHWVKPKGEKSYLVFEGKGKTPEQKSANRAAALALRTNDRVALIATREDIRAKIDEAKEEYRHSIKVTLNWLENTSEGRVQKDRIKHLKEQLRRPWTVTDVKIVYFAGVRGGVQLLAAYADPARHEDEAGKHTASIVVTNNDSVFVDHGRSRTVAQFIDYMEDRVGSEALPGEAVSNNAEEFAFNAR